MNALLALLRPLADVLDLTAEAVAAVGTVSVAAVSLVLARVGETRDEPRLRLVRPNSRL